MAIQSSDKLTVVKAFAAANPLPIDAREIHDSYEAAETYAATDATAYEGQTVKAKLEDGTMGVYILMEDKEHEDKKFKLVPIATASEAAGIKSVVQSKTAGRVDVIDNTGASTAVAAKDVMHSPAYDKAKATLTFKKAGASKDGTDDQEIVVDLKAGTPQHVKSVEETASNSMEKTITITTVSAEGVETPSTIKVSAMGAPTFDKATGKLTFGTGEEKVDVDLTDLATAPTFEDNVLTLKHYNAGKIVETRIDFNALNKEALNGLVMSPTYSEADKTITFPVKNAKGTTTNKVIDLSSVIPDVYLKGVAAGEETDGVKTLTVTVVTEGQDSTQQIPVSALKTPKYAEGVITFETAGGASKAINLKDFYKGEAVGTVVGPSYNSENRVITLPVKNASGETEDIVINLGKDMVVTSGKYNTATKDIELTLTDGSMIRIPAAALVDNYTGKATETATVTVSDTNEISVAVKKSDKEGNVLKSDTNGLYVDEADLVKTKQLITNETNARNAKIGELGEKTVKQYVDEAKTSVSSKFVRFGTQV